MLLSQIFKNILREQNENSDILEFPKQNTIVSIFRNEKKLLFVPFKDQTIPNKIRTFVNILKQNFRVVKVVDRDIGSFEVEFDPREDLNVIVDFIKNEMDK